MTGKFKFNLAAMAAILAVLLLMPTLGLAKMESGEQFKEERVKLIKGLKLPPDKEKAVLDVGDKYTAQRKEIIAGLKKSHDELQAALAAPKPDEAKVKELVGALTSGQDKLFDTFREQRNDELAQMTPIEQGKYLMALGKLRQEMMAKFKKKEAKGKK